MVGHQVEGLPPGEAAAEWRWPTGMEGLWDRPGAGALVDGPDRVLGGLFGVVGAEMTWRATAAVPYPVGAALLDVAFAYVVSDNEVTPLERVRQHAGVPGPAWLVALALAHPVVGESLIVTALSLADAAGVVGDRRQLGCAMYAVLAGCLLVGDRAGIEHAAATVREVAADLCPVAAASVGGQVPVLCRDAVVDSLVVALWALEQPSRDQWGLVETLDRIGTPPGVRAAAGGLLGLRDGLRGLPVRWCPPRWQHGECRRLVWPLLKARSQIEAMAHPGGVQ